MEKVKFKNSRGENIVGVLHKPVSYSDKIVIICHGFTSNKDRERHVNLANTLSNNKINALRFDFGASGESDNREITIGAQIEDLRAAIKFVRSSGYKKIGLLGESLGGLTVLKSYDETITAIVLWAPVTKARWTLEMSEEEKRTLKEKGCFVKNKDGKDFKIPQKYVDERLSVKREEILNRLDIPVMIAHGKNDQTIPIRDSEEFVNLAPKGSKLEPIDDWKHGGHSMNHNMDIVIPLTLNWFVDQL